MDIKPLGGLGAPSPKEVAPAPAHPSVQQQAIGGQQVGGRQSNAANTNANTANSNGSTAKPAAGQSKQQGFISPILSIDRSTGAAVLSFRDEATGSQIFQVPSRKALAYERQHPLPHAHGKTRA